MSQRSIGPFLLFFLATGTAGAGSPGTPSAVGPQFQVNTYTTGRQEYSSVAADAEGGFVVVWTSDGSFGSDSHRSSIQGQRFEMGAPAGDEFQVNTATTGSEGWPDVAAGPKGNFIVAWTSGVGQGTGEGYTNIFAQLFDETGARVGGEFLVNSYTTGYQLLSAVATSAEGDFVVVWVNAGSNGSDSSSQGIQGQRFDAAGGSLGSEFQVSTYTTGRQLFPDVAMAADGSFLAVWLSDGSSGSDLGSWSIQGRRFDAAGVPSGDDFQINTYTTGDQFSPAVAADHAHGFVVVWMSEGSFGSDSDNYSIQGQRFSASGPPIGGEFQVNSYTTRGQFSPDVAAESDGGFVVVWASSGSRGTDSSLTSVQGQRFDAEGQALGDQFQVNTYTLMDQFFPAVATDRTGGFAVVWESDGSSGSDTGFSRSVQGQRFSNPLFADGFESGDTAAWSSPVR